MRVGPQVARVGSDVDQHVYSGAGKKKGLCDPGRCKESNGEQAHDYYNSLESNLQTQPVFFAHIKVSAATVTAEKMSKSKTHGILHNTNLEP